MKQRKPRIKSSSYYEWYATPAYACFNCRKVFKRWNGVAKCPHCAHPMHSVGKGFKAPRRANAEQWKVMELLVQQGFRFAVYGELGYLGLRFPKRVNDVKPFLEALEAHRAERYEQHKKAEEEFWAQREANDPVRYKLTYVAMPPKENE